MAEPELRHDLTPEEERLAESYFCRKWGEPPVTEEMRPNAAARPGLHEELDTVDAALKAAYATVPQNDLFAERVLKALPVTSVTTAVLPPQRANRSWIWGVAGAAAAVLFLAACLWLPALQGLWSGSTAQVARGQVLDASGREVKNLVAGQTYEVAGTEAVVRVGQDASVRLLRESRFEVPAAQTSELRLHEGWAYAQSPERAEVRVESDDLTAAVKGVSLVVQATPRSMEPGEGMVLVFVGNARVRSSTGEQELVLKEGQMFTVVLGTQVVEPFLKVAEETAQQLERLPSDPAQIRAWRKQYVDVVAGYEHELSSFTKELASTQDPNRRAELERRHARVEEYLKRHRERLESLPELTESETPQERAGRMRRAVERIERGRKEFSDPHQWL